MKDNELELKMMNQLMSQCVAAIRQTMDVRDALTDIADQLGYVKNAASGGLTMSSDWAIEYFRSVLHGQRVYGFCHSAIEYVFTHYNDRPLNTTE